MTTRVLPPPPPLRSPSIFLYATGRFSNFRSPPLIPASHPHSTLSPKYNSFVNLFVFVELIRKTVRFLIFFICGLPEVSGPPEFLNNSVEEYATTRDVDQPRGGHGGRRNRKEKKDLPTGMSSFPDLVFVLLFMSFFRLLGSRREEELFSGELGSIFFMNINFLKERGRGEREIREEWVCLRELWPPVVVYFAGPAVLSLKRSTNKSQET